MALNEAEREILARVPEAFGPMPDADQIVLARFQRQALVESRVHAARALEPSASLVWRITEAGRRLLGLGAHEGSRPDQPTRESSM
jgi:hypothetical protein